MPKLREERAQVSKQFREALRNCKTPTYVLANKRGIPPGTVYALINGAVLPIKDDPRIIAIGQSLGLKPGECFQE